MLFQKLKILKPNLDNRDRFIRSLITVGLAMLAIWLNSWIIALVALFVLFESMMSWCIVYQILGKNSCPIKNQTNNQQSENSRS